MKSIIINSDENIVKIIINNNFFEPIINVFMDNQNKNNLIVSAILELFECVKKSTNMKKLLSYLFEKHYDFFYNEYNKPLFLEFTTKYEQGLDQYSFKLNSDVDDKMYIKLLTIL